MTRFYTPLKILDVCCGGKMFWFNKKNPDVMFMDIRKESHTLCDGRKFEVDPTIVADFRNIPFEDETFYLVIFDPPHLKGAGKKGWQAQKYGSLDRATWKDDIKKGFNECMRVLKVNGTLIFKWNEQTIKVSEIINIIGREPLIGHRTMQNNKTIWMAFMKLPKADAILGDGNDEPG